MASMVGLDYAGQLRPKRKCPLIPLCADAVLSFMRFQLVGALVLIHFKYLNFEKVAYSILSTLWIYLLIGSEEQLGYY